MKKFKIAIVALMLGVATYGGIQTYGHLTMTDAEKFMMQNIEALASGEASSYYQTMAYCSGHTLSYACQNRPTSERCRKYVCLINY